MGRTRTKSKKAPYGPVDSDAPEPPIEALLEKAQGLLIQCDYELAGRFIDRILQRSPHHAEAKEMLGVVQLETGDLEGAQQVCTKSSRFDLGVDFRPLNLLSPDVRIARSSQCICIIKPITSCISLSCTALGRGPADRARSLPLGRRYTRRATQRQSARK
jgi:hypothetical protein